MQTQLAFSTCANRLAMLSVDACAPLLLIIIIMLKPYERPTTRAVGYAPDEMALTRFPILQKAQIAPKLLFHDTANSPAAFIHLINPSHLLVFPTLPSAMRTRRRSRKIYCVKTPFVRFLIFYQAHMKTSRQKLQRSCQLHVVKFMKDGWYK
ncbi:unnamed protein product [Ceratitis capitata]|uniref:(Mediterranean fruit fly) hypothetical protein n=1 Tax=Ceratitis capitata TaxID=7213 RepID=A0A811VBJ6_CERCA|nr:unnamed protein product [Ceratitis capitata]